MCAFFLNPAYGLTGSGKRFFFIFEESRFVSAFYRFFYTTARVMKNIFLSPIAIKLNHHGESLDASAEKANLVGLNGIRYEFSIFAVVLKRI